MALGRWSLLVCVSLMLLGCSSMPRHQAIPTSNTPHTVYFIYRDWHTSILLDAAVVARQSQYLADALVGQKYVRIGWGDGDYFTGKSKTFGSAAKALIASNYSALQVLAYQESPLGQIPEQTRVPLALSNQGMEQLVRYIDDSFALDALGQPIPLLAYTPDTGLFYQSDDHYGLFSNCNTWSGRALQAAGLPVRSGLKLTAQSVFEQARYISLYQQAAVISGKNSALHDSEAH